MTLQAVLQYANIIPNAAGSAFETQVRAILTTLYNGSPTIRTALELRVVSGVPINFEFRAGLAESDASSGPILSMYIDPAYTESFRSINQFGVMNARGFSYSFLHELCHQLFTDIDPKLNSLNQPNFDFLGVIVRRENQIVQELEWTDLRVGYFAMSNEYVGPFPPSYSGGSEVGYAFVNTFGKSVIDASASMQKNLNGLLIGGSGNESIVGGNGNDWLHGTGGDDSVVGGPGNDRIFGGRGADDLRGSGGDDFILFDATDSIIRGGTGRDAAFVSTAQAVNINVTNSQVEIVVGGAGNDTITAGISTDAQFLAGGAGADAIRLRYGAGEGERVVWGGAGADRFEFVFPGADPNQTHTTPAGILVVNVAGLTPLNFASLTLGMLGLGGIDLSKIAAVVVNPDGSDRFFVNGVRIDAALLATDPNLQPDDGGRVFTTRLTDWLGPQLMVQASFEDRTLITPHVDFFELGSADDEIFIVVNGQTIDEGTWGVVWGSEGGADLLMTQEEALDYIDANPPYWNEPTDPQPYGPVFVAGGSFTVSALSSSGTFGVTTPPEAISPDWLVLGCPAPSPCGPPRYVPSLRPAAAPCRWNPRCSTSPRNPPRKSLSARCSASTPR